MSSTIIIIAITLLAFAAAFFLCELAMRRRRARNADGEESVQN